MQNQNNIILKEIEMKINSLEKNLNSLKVDIQIIKTNVIDINNRLPIRTDGWVWGGSWIKKEK
tara:strand:- start:580 stop:768 length:189 start_codon:yes stop_codon:yes gene_type:complete